MNPENQDKDLAEPEAPAPLTRAAQTLPLKTHLEPTSNPTAAAAERVLSEKLSTRLQRELAGIATVQVIHSPEGNPEQEILQIDVTNREQWRSPECQRRFLPLIGIILQQTFYPEKVGIVLSPDELVKEYNACDPHFMDRMILIAEGQQVRGFSMLKQCVPTKTHQKPVTALQLVSVEAGGQYAGHGKRLYSLIDRSYPDSIIVAATHTPALIAARKRNRPENMKYYFCGLREGNEDIALSEEERTMVQEAEDEYREMLRTDYDGFLNSVDQSGIPPHCINYGAGSMAWGDEHQWKIGDTSPVAQTFGRLREWVFDHGREKEGVYGMLTTLPF